MTKRLPVVSRDDGDALLAALMATSDRERREAIIARLLVEVAEPVIGRTLSRRRGVLSDADLEDVAGTARLRLLRKLENPDAAEPIASFANYVAMTALHAADDLLRRKHPRRTMLANRIRYVLTRDPRFALWEQDRELVCGLAQRRAGEPATTSELAEELARLLARGPMPFQSAVSHFATGIEEEPLREVESQGVAPEAIERLETRQLLEKLWREIVALPERQRVALLLNLRDETGGSALALIPLLGVATTAEIARALGMRADELAAVWDDLPLDDDRIGSILDARRQQIINLRKCARERLGRRMARW